MSDEVQKIEWETLSLGVKRICPYCQQGYDDNGYTGHILVVSSTEGEYRTCLTLLMRGFHIQLPGVFAFEPKGKP